MRIDQEEVIRVNFSRASLFYNQTECNLEFSVSYSVFQLYPGDMDQKTQDLDTQFLQAIQTLSKLEDIVARGTLVPHYPHQQENRLVFMH